MILILNSLFSVSLCVFYLLKIIFKFKIITRFTKKRDFLSFLKIYKFLFKFLFKFIKY